MLTASDTIMPKAGSFPAHADLGAVLVSETAIKRRLKKLGEEIAAVYGKEEITAISIINGAIIFTLACCGEIKSETPCASTASCITSYHVTKRNPLASRRSCTA